MKVQTSICFQELKGYERQKGDEKDKGTQRDGKGREKKGKMKGNTKGK